MSAQTVIIILKKSIFKSKLKNIFDCCCLSSSGLLTHKVKLDLAFIFLSFIIIIFFFIPFVSHHKLRPPPDRSVPAVVIHYGSGQSYFSGAVTPILMKLREGGRKEGKEAPRQREREREQQQKRNLKGRRHKQRRKQTSSDREKLMGSGSGVSSPRSI